MMMYDNDDSVTLPDFIQWAVKLQELTETHEGVVSFDLLVQALKDAFDQGRTYGARTTTTLKTTCSYKGVF